jgi:predicted O-methyltransferase YrrM
VTPATGAALRFFATAIAAKAVVEIGTGCGSSGIWLLRGMRPGGVLTSVDTEPEYHRMARKVFAQAGFATNQARLILGRALDVLPRLSDGGYDLVFCDADPVAYPEYLTASIRLLRAGGIAVFNDALPRDAGPAEDGARELADMIRIDDRVIPLLLPIAGGLLAAIKKLRELFRTYAWFQFSGTDLRGLATGSAWRYPTAACSASPSLTASSADSSTTSLPPPSNGTRITMPRPSLVTSSGPSPVRGFIAAILHPLPSCAHTNGPRRRGARAVLREPRAPTASRGPYQAGPARQGLTATTVSIRRPIIPCSAAEW